jgi:hypothetical protein
MSTTETIAEIIERHNETEQQRNPSDGYLLSEHYEIIQDDRATLLRIVDEQRLEIERLEQRLRHANDALTGIGIGVYL